MFHHPAETVNHHPSGGRGIFDRYFEEFSAGVDSTSNA
jgi:hypothetical protein